MVCVSGSSTELVGFQYCWKLWTRNGYEFAKALYRGLNTIFLDLSEEGITKSRHMEKFCLISPRVGRDKISDFTANYAKEYLLEYTQRFAKEYISSDLCRSLNIPKVKFDWTTNTWSSKEYYLPYFDNDFVLLTPKDMLTRDEKFINRDDMFRNLQNIIPSIPDDVLRFELNQYFRKALVSKRKHSKRELECSLEALIRKYPNTIDYYLKYKEDHQ